MICSCGIMNDAAHTHGSRCAGCGGAHGTAYLHSAISAAARRAALPRLSAGLPDKKTMILHRLSGVVCVYIYIYIYIYIID